MDAFIPVGGAGADATLVQSRVLLPGPGASINQSPQFNSPVTSGNLLVVLLVTRATNGPFSAPAGWSGGATIDANGFNGGSGALFYKVCDSEAGGTAIGTFGTAAGTQRRIVLAEFSGPTEFADVEAIDSHAATTALALGAVTPTSGAPSLLLAAVLNGGTISSIGDYTSIAGGFVEGGINGPYSRIAYKAVNPASGSYNVTTSQSSAFECASDHVAFSGDAGGVVWTIAPDTVDADEGTSDTVTDTAIAGTSGAFWRGDLGAAQLIGRIDAVLGFEDAGAVTVLVQAGDASDWSDATTIVQLDYEATGGYTADDLSVTWDPADSYRYWRLVLDTAAQGVRVYEVGLTVQAAPPGVEPGKAILEIYVHDEDASRWGEATWATGPATGTEGIWSAAGWTDVTPEGVNVHWIWGSRRPSRGILHEQDGASLNIQTYDPDRILDPGNPDSPYYPQLVPNLPVRVSHGNTVIRTGLVEEMTWSARDPYFQGQMLGTDTIGPLHLAGVPADSILGDTLLERIQDAVNAAGIMVGGIPLPPGGPAGPALSEWVEGAATDDDVSVWTIIRKACQEVLWVPYVNADASLGLRPWGSPLDRGREITATNLEDNRHTINEDGTYSVVSVQVADPDLAPIIRVAAPLPRYGRRMYERRETTIDPEGWAAAVLADRAWPGVQYIPGTIHCFTAADVDYFGSLETMERVTITVPGIVTVQGRILGGELWVEHRKGSESGATWQFLFSVATDGATAIGLTTLVSDQGGEPLLDDMTETDFLEAD